MIVGLLVEIHTTIKIGSNTLKNKNKIYEKLTKID